MKFHSPLCMSVAAAAITLMYPASGAAQALRDAAAQTAAETKFTITPGSQQPLVIKTLPNSVCDLHASPVADGAQTMRLYADVDGYVRVHVQAKQSSTELGHLQLDCQADGKLTTYPLTFRADATPTEEMPAPQLVRPQPRDAKLLPALTENEAQQLSDLELAQRGYAPRPDAATSPENYAAWLKLVSQPLTMVAPHSVSRSDISHRPRAIEAGTETTSNWSGYELRSSQKSYLGVQAQWNVPPIPIGESNHITYSAFWVGLDGDGISDLVQAGTEQDYVDIWILQFASYGAWTELLPNQPTEQELSGLSINPNDSMLSFVWVGDSNGQMDPNGGYGWFLIADFTTGQATRTATALNGTHFNGREAEWIMERPLVNGAFGDLSCYIIASMTGSYAWTTKELAVPYSTSGNLQLTMHNNYATSDDNNTLSIALPATSNQIDFFWQNFH